MDKTYEPHSIEQRWYEFWEGQGVPEVLLSGHHERIEIWRRQQRLTITAQQRPDLIVAARLAGRLSSGDEAWLASLAP